MSKYTAITLIVDRDFDKWNVDHGRFMVPNLYFNVRSIKQVGDYIEIKHGGTWWRPKKVLISKNAVLGIRYWKDQDSLNKEILGEDYAKETEDKHE